MSINLSEQFGFEILVMPVGEVKSGDAILFRYKDMGIWHSMIIDGGTIESGKNLVRLLQDNRIYEVEHVINTHPDADHASGLSVVLEELRVGQLWMHQPWNHFRNHARTLRQGLPFAWKLAELANDLGVNISEPFQGTTIGALHVLSPSREMYLELVPQFRCMSESSPQSFTQDDGTLADDPITSAENETSVVLYGDINSRQLLFTGDAGVNALSCAVNYVDQLRGSFRISLNNLRINLENLDYVQIPHHGSRNNVTLPLLSRIRGRIAWVSVALGDRDHPHFAVVKAFESAGAEVHCTKGNFLQFSHF